MDSVLALEQRDQAVAHDAVIVYYKDAGPGWE
jgi:hypothetical protein